MSYRGGIKERDFFYRDLMFEFWILFDDKMRSICGVEIDLDLDHAKPIRLPPHRLSPAKTEIAKALIQEFIEETPRAITLNG